MALINRRHLVRLEREVDVFIARELAAAFADERGFDRYQVSDVETAVSELATNVLKYGERGWASLRINQKGFEAVVTDEGPGFDAAPKSRSGLRVGLSGVKRLMDTIEIESRAEGSQITVRKDLRTSHPENGLPGWEIDVVGRSRSGKSTCGDDFWIRDSGGALQVAVIDGLGTGQGAARASATVIESLDATDAGTPLDEMIALAHERARSSRGAVCLLARVDPGSQTIEYTGVGDISGFVEPPGERLALDPGILGVDQPEVRLSRLPWTDQSRLIVWTDGIKAAPVELVGPEPTMSAGDWAEVMTLNYGVDRDDGLILMARMAETT